jgi:NADP-dependent 3-hydroxy acid dehydrogenase YdfG
VSELQGRALVTGGGRGIGANVARELATAGMEVWVTGRTAEQVEAVAAEIGGHALVGDVSRRIDVERWVRDAEPIDLLSRMREPGTAVFLGSSTRRSGGRCSR